MSRVAVVEVARLGAIYENAKETNVGMLLERKMGEAWELKLRVCRLFKMRHSGRRSPQFAGARQCRRRNDAQSRKGRAAKLNVND